MHTLVVIQNRNDARFLPAVINSVLAQTVKSYILVGIDAGSTDNSVAVYESYSQWMDWVDCAGLNQAASVNKALRQYWRTHDWDSFVWVNADDWLTPDHLVKHWHALGERPEVDIVCGDALIFYEEEYKHGVRPFVAGDVVAAWRKNRNMVCQPATMIRRRVFEKIGLFDESVVYPFDYEFWVRAYNNGHKFHVLQEPTAWRRKMKDCMSSTRDREIQAEMELIHRQFYHGTKRRLTNVPTN